MPSWSSVAAGRRDVVGSAANTASHPLGDGGSGGRTVVSKCTTTQRTDTTTANPHDANAPTNPPTSPVSTAGSGPPPPSSFADALLNRSPPPVSRPRPGRGPIAASVNDRPKTSSGSASVATATATTTAGSTPPSRSPPPSSQTKDGKGRGWMVEGESSGIPSSAGRKKHENSGTREVDHAAHRRRQLTASKPARPEGIVIAGGTSEAPVAKSSSKSNVDGSAVVQPVRAPPQSAPPERPPGAGWAGGVAQPPPSSSGDASSRTGVENGHNNSIRRSSPHAPGRGGGRGAASGGRGRGAVVVGNNKSAKNKGDTHGHHPLPPICHFYRQNRCRAGSRCRFRHSDDVDEGASTSVKFRRSGRAFCPIKGSAVRLALALQDAEPMTWREFDTLDDESGPFYGVDVECVATGHGHRDRAPARVAVVDWRGEVVLDEFVRFPEDDEIDGDNNDGKGGRAHQKVVSYLTPLTGLTREMCQRPENLTIDGVIEKVREVLPSDAVLVGHGVQHDVDWLRLRRGMDYGDSVDTVAMFRRRVPPPSSLATFASRALAAYSSEKGGGVDGIIGGDDYPRAVAVREAAAAVLEAIKDAKVAREEAGAAVAIEAESENGESSTGGDRRADEEGDGDDAGEDRRSANPEPQPQPTPPISPPPPPPMARYRIFSLRHVCLHLLGVDVQDGSHDPTVDARYSLKLFLKYRRSSPEMLRAARDALHRAPPTSGFAALHPVVDGVCLSRESYRYKHAARFIWRWWIGVRWKLA